MFKKTWIGLVFAGLLSASGLYADVVVRIAPPRPVVERHDRAPGRGYIWINGYQRWDGRRYVWAPGRWELPPRPHAHWQPHRWHKRHGEYVFEEGRWR
jgi:hypothetical protein